VPQLPARSDRPSPSSVRVRGPRPASGPPAEVRWVAGRGRGACPGDGAELGRPRGMRPRDVGPALEASAREPGVRPGRGPGPGGGARARASRGPAPRTRLGSRRLPGPTRWSGPASGRARPVRPGPAPQRARAPRRRRPHDGGHRGGLRLRARPRGRGPGEPAGRGEVGPAGVPPKLYSSQTRARVCGCPGRGSPVVDASRRRNDPRKATLGRRAWCGLDVSPASRGRPRGAGAQAPAQARPTSREKGLSRPQGTGGCSPRGTHGRRSPPQASVGPKTRSAERGSHLLQRREGQAWGLRAPVGARGAGAQAPLEARGAGAQAPAGGQGCGGSGPVGSQGCGGSGPRWREDGHGPDRQGPGPEDH
jgi:hypothetical protein